ncbi:MAG: Gfo/Idh/MocA family oxidoreductase [Candidatus Cloacimonadota bacterium]|nr:Gfo/Idh/MocA family oxidoreductase [Candidatus Cloacimonadota bacterium]
MNLPKIAVIGSGSWGFNHVRTFYSLKNCELVCVCDLIPENLQRVKKQFPDVNTENDYKKIIISPDIDAVVVATNAETHYEIAKNALIAGKHCFVEKPITLNINGAEELVDLANQNKLILMVGHLLLYHSAIDYLKNLVDDKKIGDVLYIYSQRVNLGKVRSTENALWSFAPHDISIMLFLINEKPVRVSATGQSFLQKKEQIYDVVFFTIYFENGVIATGQVSWLDPHKIRKFTIVGSKKMVTFDDMEIREKIRIYDKGVDASHVTYDSFAESLILHDGDITIPKINLGEPLKREDSHFIDCIMNHEKPLTDGQNGLDVLKVLVAAQKSLENNGQPEKI